MAKYNPKGLTGLKQHEFGHVLQYNQYGATVYWGIIAPSSLVSATGITGDHDFSWMEEDANRLAHKFFGALSLMGNTYGYMQFPLPTPVNNWGTYTSEDGMGIYGP